MKKKINISVIIPNFNRTNLLKRSVNSVLNQTYSVDEIIIVDDYSSRIVRENYRSYFKDNLKIKLIFNPKNMGAAYSRNIGVKNARNDIIAFLDSDDIWHKDKIKKQIDLISLENNVHLVYCAQSKHKLHRGNVLNNLINFWLMPNTSTILVTKEAFCKVNGFDERLKACQDHDFWISFSKAGFCVDYVDEDLVVFTDDAENRISYEYESRFNAAKLFLLKWRETIISYKGKKYYKSFHDKYISLILSQIIVANLKKKKYTNSLKIYFKHLFFNIYFYLKIFKFVKKKYYSYD